MLCYGSSFDPKSPTVLGYTLSGPFRDARLEKRQWDFWSRDTGKHNFADETALYIPKVYWDYATQWALTLERISGIKIEDIAALIAGVDRRQVAKSAARIVIKEVLEDGFFHADPHPGNFFVMDEAVIEAMDFGMVGHLDRRGRENLGRFYIVSVQLDTEGIIEQFI